MINLFSFLFAKQPETKQPEPTEKETAFSSNSIMFNMVGGFQPYNPDDLIGRKGFAIYKKMLRDDQVKAAYLFLTSLMLSRAWRFEKTEDTPQQQEIEDYYNEMIKRLPGTFTTSLKKILLSIVQGYSMTEINYEMADFNGSTKWFVKSLKKKPFETFVFMVDEFGEINGLRQNIGGKKIDLDIDKFIYSINNPEFDEIYGESDLRSAYRAYWEKDIILKLETIYLEKFAGGFLVVTAEKDAPNIEGPELTSFENTLKNVTQLTAIKLPKGHKAEILKTATTQAFQKAVEQRNRSISRSLLMPSLSGLTDQQQTGGYAQSKTQGDFFLNVISQKGDELAEILNEQLFQPLAKINFGVDNPPVFKFEKMSESEKAEAVEQWGEAIQKGAVINGDEDEKRTRELLDYPPIDENREVTTADINEEPKKKDDAEEFSKLEFAKSGDKEIVERINPKAMKSKMEALEETWFDEFSDLMDGYFADVKKSLLKQFRNTDDTTLDTKNISKKMKRTIMKKWDERVEDLNKKHLIKQFNTGAVFAKSALFNVLNGIDDIPEAREKKIRKAITSGNKLSFNFSSPNFVTGMERATAESFINSAAFWITGDISDTLMDHIRKVFLSGIERGISAADAVEELEGSLDGLLGTPTDRAQRARIENIVRTNALNIFTQAQLSVYNDPDLEGFVQALEFSAIIDGRTTTICRDLDGRIYPINDPIWASLTPPNHFNDRTVLIPVTEFDEWKPTTSKVKVPPLKGFGKEILEDNQ